MDVLLVSGLNDNQQTKTKDLILDQFGCLCLEHCTCIMKLFFSYHEQQT